MNALWLAAGLLVAVGVGYGALSLAVAREGRQIVDRYARAPRATASGDEERIYVRRSRRRGWGRRRALAYERPLDIGEVPAQELPDDEILPPPREVQGLHGEA